MLLFIGIKTETITKEKIWLIEIK